MISDCNVDLLVSCEEYEIKASLANDVSVMKCSLS